MPRLKNSGWERFCREYIRDLKAGPSYIRAGYSKNGSDQSAAALLRNPKIKARIAELSVKVEDKIEDAAVMLRKNLYAMAGVKFNDVFDANHNLRPMNELSEGALLLIQGVKWKDGELTEVKVLDKLRAMELLGKHQAVGAWAENVNLSMDESTIEIMDRITSRRSDDPELAKMRVTKTVPPPGGKG